MFSTRATDMHISDTGPGDSGYRAALDAFLDRTVQAGGQAGLVRCYAAVQAMPYFSGPDRTPLAALRTGRGACTAKHIILRDLLRRLDMTAVVEIVEGDFATGIPLHPTQAPDLQAMIRQAGVTDFHCRVRLVRDEGDLLLDATWPPALGAYGFVVSRGWTADSDTVQAIRHVTVRSQDDDVLGEKARLLAGLEEEPTRRRQEFLRLLSGWLAGLETEKQN